MKLFQTKQTNSDTVFTNIKQQCNKILTPIDYKLSITCFNNLSYFKGTKRMK